MMKTHRFARALAMTSALSLIPAAAHAQPTEKPAATGSPAATAQAREHFQRGVKLYEEDDFRTALIEFKRAYELAPNSTILFNIGNSYYQLREYAEALKNLEQYVREVGAAIPKESRAQADREIEELRGRVAHVTFTSNVPGAELTMDDAKVGALPLPQNQIISSGRHRLSLSKPGYRTVTKDVDIAGGDTLSIPFEMKAEELTVMGSPPVIEKSGGHAGSIAAFSIGVVGLAVGTVAGIAALSNKSDLDDACVDKVCPRSAQDNVDSFSRNGIVSTIGFAVGGAGLVLGGILYYAESSRKREDRTMRSRQPFVLRAGGAGLMTHF